MDVRPKLRFCRREIRFLRTTIRDIAAETGLSIATVSMILNNKGDKFPPQTRKTVLETARRMNYHPNQMAVGLITRQTRTLGLIIPDISNVFFSEFAKGIECTSRQKGYNVILSNSDDKFDQESNCIQVLSNWGIDGIVIILSAESFGEKNEECLQNLRNIGVPVILADCFNEVSDFTTIEIDNYRGSILAVEHLIKNGHRRIACIVGPQGLKSNKLRREGYTDTLRLHGIEPNPEWVYEGDFRYDSGYEGARKLLEQNPTAIYCHNDMMAYGAMRAAMEAGLRVPEDISVIGFDDIFFSQHIDVPLTTVKQPVYKMGQLAAKILLEEIKDPRKEKQHIVFQPLLVVRRSVSAAQGA